ncbi:MAG: hypothetical protein ACOCX5_01705 [Chloroflexota bacterium]
MKRLLIFTIIIALFAAAPASAQVHDEDTSIRVLGFEQFDTNNDGQPEQAKIICNCISERDEIIVVDTARDMQPSDRWSTGTDMRNDIWLYDAYGDGTVNLIQVFTQDENGNAVARFYDDVDGDGVIEHRITRNGVQISESEFWSAEVTAQGDWFRPDGQPNLNVEVLVDMPFYYGGFEFFYGVITRNWIANDGRPDAIYRLVDENDDGIADYFHKQLLAELQTSSAFGKGGLNVNIGGYTSEQIETALLWPFLDFRATPNARGLRYFDVTPTFLVDWNSSQLQGYILPGYPIESGLHINSIAPIVPNELSYPNLEAPHAYYDLAENRNDQPDLNIRILMPNVAPNSPDQTAFKEVRYSWAQTSVESLQWDYKFGTMGNHPFDTVYEVGDLMMQMVPYEELPTWVIERPWNLTTFVVRESGGNQSSEGIYDWTPREGVNPIQAQNPSRAAINASTEFLTGDRIEPPYDIFDSIAVGMRGEYLFARPTTMQMYFSPITQRLHMVNAEWGLANIDDTYRVISTNMNEDAYLDAWHQIDREGVVSSLYHLHDYLIFADQSGLRIKAVDLPPALFETSPPTDHETWRTLGDQLSLFQPDELVRLDDFGQMFNSANGPVWNMKGVLLKNLRLTPYGMRLVIEIEDGYTSYSELRGLNVSNYPPGDYVIEWDLENGLAISPLSPAELELQPDWVAFSRQTLRILDSTRVNVRVANQGMQDVYGATLALYELDGDERILVDQAEFDIYNNDTEEITLIWTPRTSGDRSLAFEIWLPEDYANNPPPRTKLVLNAWARQDAGLPPFNPLAQAEEDEDTASTPVTVESEKILATNTVMTVSVEPLLRVSSSKFLSLNGVHPLNGVLIIIMLASIATIGLSLFWLITREQTI